MDVSFFPTYYDSFCNDYFLKHFKAHRNIVNLLSSYVTVSLPLIFKLLLIHSPYGAQVVIAVDMITPWHVMDNA